MIDELSFTALAEIAVVGHVTASRAKVGFDSVVAVGPIGVLPEHQGKGIGSALMRALLGAADAQDVPLVVLLGSPQYYGRFGFRAAAELGVVAPEPKWETPSRLRPLRAYTRPSPGHSSSRPRSRPRRSIEALGVEGVRARARPPVRVVDIGLLRRRLPAPDSRTCGRRPANRP